MKAVILSAGVASRLRPITDRMPKCLLPVGGQTLLQRTIDSLTSAGIADIVIVIGFHGDTVRSKCAEVYPGRSFTWVENRRFESTNNAYSLLLAREHVAGNDCLILDGDILFDPRLIAHLVSGKAADSLLVRPSHFLGNEEVKVITDGKNRITAISKEVDPRLADGESIGIERFSAQTAERLFEILERRICAEHREQELYEAGFQELIDNGTAIAAVDTAGLACIEIDTPLDIETAERDVLPLLGA